MKRVALIGGAAFLGSYAAQRWGGQLEAVRTLDGDAYRRAILGLRLAGSLAGVALALQLVR